MVASAGLLLPRPIRAQQVFGRGPAPTLERAGSTVSVPDDDGFIRRWLVLEPIAVDGRLNDSAVRAKVDAEHFPDQLTLIPVDGQAVSVGGEMLTWHAVDTHRYNLNLYHFAYALEKPTSNVLF